MHRLSPQDASFLHLEDTVSHMHVGAIALCEGPRPDYDSFAQMVRAKLDEIPRYRQRVHFVPLALGRPVWVDDPHFNIGYHVRRTALARPGGDDELRALVGRVMSQQLDRGKPLWEMWIIEGLTDDRWALITKLHHCMVDGVAGAELLSAVLDDAPDIEHAGDGAWIPERQPSGAELALRALGARARSPVEELRALGGSLRDPRASLTHAGETLQGALTLAGVLRRPAPSSLNGPIGPHRRWGWARSSLADVKQIRRSLGGTVNDVVLAAIAGAFRELLLSRGEPADHVVRSLVPVSVRKPEEHGIFENRVSAMFADLPADVEDPVERLHAVRRQLGRLKHTHEALAGDALVALGAVAPAMLLALGLRTVTHVPQRNVQTVTTNVPGPQHTLYAAGRRVIDCFPYVPLAGHVRIGVAIFSYDGELNFGVTGDYDEAPDIGVLCRAIEADLARLLEIARAHEGGEPSGNRRHSADAASQSPAAGAHP